MLIKFCPLTFWVIHWQEHTFRWPCQSSTCMNQPAECSLRRAPTNKTRVVFLLASADPEQTHQQQPLKRSVCLCTACEFLQATAWALHQNGNHGDLLSKWKGSKWILQSQAQWRGCYWTLNTISAPWSSEGPPLTDATVGSLRRKVMDTGPRWKELENNWVTLPVQLP